MEIYALLIAKHRAKWVCRGAPECIFYLVRASSIPPCPMIRPHSALPHPRHISEAARSFSHRSHAKHAYSTLRCQLYPDDYLVRVCDPLDRSFPLAVPVKMLSRSLAVYVQIIIYQTKIIAALLNCVRRHRQKWTKKLPYVPCSFDPLFIDSRHKNLQESLQVFVRLFHHKW